MNAKVQAWFDLGQIAEAVIGDGDFFIREPGPVVHDRIFILQQLHDWATMEERVASATAGVELAVETLLGSDRPDEAVDVLICLAVLAEENVRIPLDPDRVARWLGEAEAMYAEHAHQRIQALERVRRTFIAELT